MRLTIRTDSKFPSEEIWLFKTENQHGHGTYGALKVDTRNSQRNEYPGMEPATFLK